jgi:cytochrome c-type biogenesis protein CcmF
VVEKREALKVWTVLLAIGTFSLSLSGTFLVRSGILNSVHSFATDPGRGMFILGLLALVIGGSLLLFAFRAPILAPSGLFAPISREGALVVNNILLCSMATVILTGTTFPLFADLLAHAKISVGAPFFNATVFPLAIPLMLAMAVGPTLSWKRAELAPALARLWWAALIAAFVGAFVEYGWHRVMPALAFLSAAWIIAGSAAEVIERIRLFRIPFASSLARAASLPLATWGSAIAHAGQTTHVAGYDWTLTALHDEQGPNYIARVATIDVTRNGHQVVTLSPSRRSFPVQRTTTTDTAIKTNFLWDLYAVLGEERGSQAVLRLHFNPLAPWIWLGALVMASGGALSLIDRRLRVGAPARRGLPAIPA